MSVQNSDDNNKIEKTLGSKEQLPTDINPKELQQELEKLVRSKFGNRIQVVSQKLEFDPLGEDINDDVEEDEENFPLDLKFDYMPKEVKAYLDKYIIGQDEAKKTLSIAVCDHYNHIRKRLSGQETKSRHYQKQNILMLGPTGVGKTYLIKKIAELIGVPFVKADATKFTEAGYVGANVEDTIRDLVNMADGNISLAQFGIVYIDEADKLAQARRVAGRDVSGRGVQNGFLKLLEETEVDTKNPFDMIAQMSSAMGGKSTKKTINTKDVLFIFSGAFSGLEDIIKKRLNKNQISLTDARTISEKSDDYFSQVITKDLIDFGMEPELIGRLPVKAHCQELTETDLFNILKYSEDSIVLQYQDAFESYGIKLEFSDEALGEIAKRALFENTGARSLMSIIEKLLRDYKFELPSTKVDYVYVDKFLVSNPHIVLAKLLNAGFRQ